MSIKKAYTEIHSLIQKNKGKPLNDELVAELNKLMSGKSGGGGASTSVLKDKDGKVVAIKCYYYKRWMPVVGENAVEFGVKKSSASGFASMCKEGLKLWNAQYNTFKKAKDTILDDVASGKLKATDVAKHLETLEANRAKIASTKLGFAKEADVKKALEAIKVVF